MQIFEGKVDNQGVSIHYIESFVDSTVEIADESIVEVIVEAKERPPLLIVPGFTESAEDYIEIIRAFEDRKCIAITLRGRWKSDAPASGYTLEDHVSDIQAVVEQLALDSFYVLGYSRGVSYMIEYALCNLPKIKGMIIGDYPGMHTRLVDRWVEMFIKLPPWRGKSALERMPRHAIEAIQRESVEKPFYDALRSVKVPVLLLKGDQNGSLLSEVAKAFYFEALEDVRLSVFKGCAHDLFKPDESHFIRVVKEFVDDKI